MLMLPGYTWNIYTTVKLNNRPAYSLSDPEDEEPLPDPDDEEPDLLLDLLRGGDPPPSLAGLLLALGLADFDLD